MPHSNEQLVEWLDAISRLDRVAFKSLYEETAPHLLALTLRILKRRDLAEEALQDSFLKIWNKSTDFDPGRGHAFSWIATIVRNQCLDQLRKIKRAPLAKEELKEEMTADTGPSSLEKLETFDRGRALKRCLEELSEDERSSILLAYWKGLTHHELSEVLERPLGTVKTWVKRGLEKLKRCIEA